MHPCRRMHILSGLSVMVFVLAWMISSASTLHAQSPVTLARDGQTMASIVVQENAPAATQFAATELQKFLSLVTGATFEIRHQPSDSGSSIFLGYSPTVEKHGLTLDKLKPDGFYQALINGNLYLVGRDDPSDKFMPVDRDELYDKEHGTLNAVYNFLEQECGVRWLMPGEIGQVIPKLDVLTIEPGIHCENPVFTDRKMDYLGHFLKFKDIDDFTDSRMEMTLWLMRQRWTTDNFQRGLHSTDRFEFGKRFGQSNPEYFALQKDGQRAINTRRGSYLCWSEPGVAKEFIKDARAWLQGQPPQSRGLSEWSANCFTKNQVCVDPNDAYKHYACQCDKCTAIQKKYGADAKDYSSVIWPAIVEVARGIEDIKGAYISTLAYPPKLFTPQAVQMPSNVHVRLCITGAPSIYAPDLYRQELALLQQWSKLMHGNLALFTYQNISRFDPLEVAMETMPRATAQFYRDTKPYIRGARILRAGTQMTTNMLDYYIAMRLLWNPDQSVDELLDDYFLKGYGPAAKPVAELYERLESLWQTIYTFYPNLQAQDVRYARGKRQGAAKEQDLWNKIYTDQQLTQFDHWLTEAQQLAQGSPQIQARISLLRKNFYDPLKAKRDQFFTRQQN